MSEDIERVFDRENALKLANKIVDTLAYHEFYKEGVGSIEIGDDDFGNDPDDLEDNYFSFIGKWGVWREGEVHYYCDDWSWYKSDFYEAYDEFYNNEEYNEEEETK